VGNRQRVLVSTTTLCAALGSQTPTVAVPYASQELTNHPAWSASLVVLRRSGIRIVDPQHGSPEYVTPINPGTGAAKKFRWEWVFERIAQGS
jgi:hypothetical protein